MDADAFDQMMMQAIEAEIEARDFYKEAAQRVEDPGVKALFSQFAKEEEKHRETLEVYRYNPVAKVEFAKMPDYRVAEAEPDVPLSFEMKPADALQLAMKKEQAAMAMYRKWADACENAELKKVYEQLSEMERGHKTRIEEMFVNTAYPEVW